MRHQSGNWIVVFGWIAAFAIAGSASAVAARGAPLADGQPLTDRGLQNLHAFAKLYGYVRYFHPSDQSGLADWSKLAISGVHKVEAAKNAVELTAILNELFSPIAPTLRVYVTGSKVPPRSPWLRPRHGRGLIGFRYHGAPEYSNFAGGLYRVERLYPLHGATPDYAADLGGGASAIIPVTLYKDDFGTLPHVPFLPERTGNETANTSGNDRATRLGDIVIAWNVFQHFYPNFDYAPVNWSAQLDASLREAATDDGKIAFRGTLRRLVAALHDGHGFVSMAQHAEFDLPLDWSWLEDQLIITAVAPKVQGIAVGDVVLSIDGKPVTTIAIGLASQTSASTKQWQRFAMWNDFLRQDTDATVEVEVQHSNGTSAKVALTPLKNSSPTPVIQQQPALEPVKELQPGLWYIDFSRTDAKGVDALIPKLVSAKAVIFDLRQYPSGDPAQLLRHLSDAPLRTQRFLVPVFTRPDRSEVIYDDISAVSAPLQPRLNAKFVFLCGGGTISYGESVLSIVTYYRLGTIVGEATGGESGGANPFILPGGYWVGWTGTRVLNQDGSRFIGVGIHPNVTVKRTIAGVTAGRDEVVEAAIKIVGPASSH